MEKGGNLIDSNFPRRWGGGEGGGIEEEGGGEGGEGGEGGRFPAKQDNSIFFLCSTLPADVNSCHPDVTTGTRMCSKWRPGCG